MEQDKISEARKLIIDKIKERMIKDKHRIELRKQNANKYKKLETSKLSY
jgi:hypothetical protein